MPNVRRLVFLAGLLLVAVPGWSADNLPTLPSSGPAGLPTLNTSSINMVTATEQNLSVTCYLGNPNDRQTLGSITVNTPADAGIVCNSMNYACRGRCFGCYSDFDLSEDICVDVNGRRYLR